jgi:glycosyltransferase involved in cell wall biosynthesis
VRVLHIHKITGVGGSERHLLTLLPALRERGVDARFVGLDVEGSDALRFYRELEAAGVPGRHVRCTVDVNPRMAADVIRAVRDEAPDLLHTHLVHGDVYGTIASRALGIPFVSTRHNDDRYLLGPFRFVDRAFASGTSRIVAISHAVRRFLVETAGLPPERIEMIHYGLDDPPEAPSELTPGDAGVPPGAPLLLAVGRLTEQKDHATTLRALASLRKRRPEAVLAILGIGPLEQETRRLAHKLGLADSVLLPGRVEVRDWLAAASVLVHSSRWEGFGMVLLEAMLAGLPVAATRVSAVPEIVADGETGLLVQPGDWQGLARTLDRLLADPARARALGEAGRERAHRRFSVARMTERTLALYESLRAPCDPRC